MPKWIAALWRAPEVERKSFEQWLVEEWAQEQLASPELAGLAVRLELADQSAGQQVRVADSVQASLAALVSLWSDVTPERACSELAPRAARVAIWRVEEQRQKRYPRDWSDGERTPGLAMVSLLRPPPDRKPAECQRYWVERHTPLALRVHQGLWSYTQNVVLETVGTEGADVIGIAELQFRTPQDYRERMFVPPAAVDEIMADVPRFMSLRESESVDMSELWLRTSPEESS